MTDLAITASAGKRGSVVARGPSRFFLGASAAMLLIVLAGFAPTFYLRSLFPVRPIPAYLYVHGIVMTAWYLLLMAQTSLVAAGRRDLHQRLGIAGVVVAAAVLVLGFYTNRNLLPRVHAAGIPVSPELEAVLRAVTIIGLFLLAAFAVFVTSAILLRRRPEAHRRLMYLALLATLPPTLGSARWIGRAFAQMLSSWPGLIPLAVWGFVLALVLHDWSSHRRIHPATLAGGLFLIVGLLVTDAITGNALAGAGAVL